jgi:hypothetical protein
MSSSTSPVKAKILADQVWADIKRRAAAAGTAIRSEAQTAKTALAPAGIGALVGLISSIDDIKNTKMFKEHWWLLPLAIMALGYYYHRKQSPHGRAIMATGAMLLVQAYNSRPKEQSRAATTTTATTIPTTKPAGETSGLGDAVQIHHLGNGYAWIQSPTGQLVRVELAPMLRQFSPALQTQSPAAAAPAQDAAARLAAAAFA